MKKLAIFSGLAIVAVTATYLLLPYEYEMTYRESDRVRYHLYTPAAIKQAPRLSPDYTFSRSEADGQPGSAGVCFSGISDTAALKQYLVSRGASLSHQYSPACTIALYSVPAIFTGIRLRYREHGLPVSENLLKQDFYASGSNQKWVGNITYLCTGEGWLYLAVVIDLWSRQSLAGRCPCG